MLWFYAQGEALRWFTDGEPPRLLRPLVRAVRPHALRLEQARRRLLRRPAPQPIPPVLLTLELRRLELRGPPGRGERRAAPAPLGSGPCSRPTTSSSSSSASGSRCPPTDVGLPPLPSSERLALEAELVAAGHDW